MIEVVHFPFPEKGALDYPPTTYDSDGGYHFDHPTGIDFTGQCDSEDWLEHASIRTTTL